MVARENNEKAESQIDSSSSNPLRWYVQGRVGYIMNIFFHPTNNNRLGMSVLHDNTNVLKNLVYNVDDGSQRPDVKINENKCQWSKDRAVKISFRGRSYETIWTHCKSKN